MHDYPTIELVFIQFLGLWEDFLAHIEVLIEHNLTTISILEILVESVEEVDPGSVSAGGCDIGLEIRAILPKVDHIYRIAFLNNLKLFFILNFITRRCEVLNQPILYSLLVGVIKVSIVNMLESSLYQNQRWIGFELKISFKDLL